MSVYAYSRYDGALPPPPEPPSETAELHVVAEHVRRGRCVLFVGAGLSAAAGLPDWGRLMQALVEQATPYATGKSLVPPHFDLEDDPQYIADDRLLNRVRRALGAPRYDELVRAIERTRRIRSQALLHIKALEIVGANERTRAELQRLLDARRYPEVTSRIRRELGETEFIRVIGTQLAPTRELPEVHRQVVRTPWSCIVTTNFDDLLERAYECHGQRGRPRAPTGGELSSLGTLLVDGGFFILKAHGDLARPDAMVFSTEDYQRVIHESPAFQATMASILMTNAVVFVGYSLNDVNFRLLLDQQLSVFRGHVPPRYALLAGVGDVEAQLLWRTARLRVLRYPAGEHHHVQRFLTTLADAVSAPLPMEPVESEDPRAPQEPAPLAPPRRARRDVHGHPTAYVSTRVTGDHLELRLATRGTVRTWHCTPDSTDFTALLRATASAIHAHSQRWNAMASINSVTRQLTRWLPEEFTAALAALPRGCTVRFDCRDGTHRIPWEWVGQARATAASRLALYRGSVVLSDAARGRRQLQRGGAALVIGDAGSGTGALTEPLDGAEREADAIVALLGATMGAANVCRLSRANATRAAIMEALGSRSWDVVHLAGHAWFDEFESYFHVWDGLLLGSQLTPLFSVSPPALLVMSTHFTSFRPVAWDDTLEDVARQRTTTLRSLGHADLSGFAEVAMRCGVGAFVGCFGEPPDQATADLMERFYAQLLAGDTVASALLRARRALIERTRHKLTSALMFTVTGDGELRMQ
jgi:hypothetical protein